MSWISLLTNIYPQTYCVREKEEIKSDGISFTVNFNIFLFLILLPPFFFPSSDISLTNNDPLFS